MGVKRFRMPAKIAFALLWSGFSLAIAAAGQIGETPVRRPSQPPGNAAPEMSDMALERAITQRFAKSAIASNGFTVSVSGGVATLRGIAQVAQHKGVATRLARSAGARQVRNQIELGAPARDAMRRLRQRSATRPKSPKSSPNNRSSSGKRPRTGAGKRSPGSVSLESAPTLLNSQPVENEPAPLRKSQDSVTNSTGRASNRRANPPVKRFRVLQPGAGKSFPNANQRHEQLRRY